MPVLSSDRGLRSIFWMSILLFARGTAPTAESPPYAAFLTVGYTPGKTQIVELHGAEIRAGPDLPAIVFWGASTTRLAVLRMTTEGRSLDVYDRATWMVISHITVPVTARGVMAGVVHGVYLSHDGQRAGYMGLALPSEVSPGVAPGYNLVGIDLATAHSTVTPLPTGQTLIGWADDRAIVTDGSGVLSLIETATSVVKVLAGLALTDHERLFQAVDGSVYSVAHQGTMRKVLSETGEVQTEQSSPWKSIAGDGMVISMNEVSIDGKPGFFAARRSATTTTMSVAMCADSEHPLWVAEADGQWPAFIGDASGKAAYAFNKADEKVMRYDAETKQTTLVTTLTQSAFKTKFTFIPPY